MASATLTTNQYVDIPGTAEVKVSNATGNAGAVRVACPNVPYVDYAVPANGSRNLQIPIGTTRFTNIGAPTLTLTW
ncbi:hypothetical protein JY651_02265 [Pyxidicoccus parkwayensis]|uniref:Uncharacterized protein n=1 Tax=Pyxidicoccus parkwayensis TaxID=2813578 RepID=A0ABX7NY35_9BACT|nr:hypothetical protein [Pyxidicoccus parkwaysis]QSQ23831.1 hypothetical protein JY651_02265 [Pyxidicoccus parkwaysis]